VDILYVLLKGGIAVDSEEIDENIHVEYGKDDEVIGVEVYNVSKLVAKPLANKIKDAMKL